MTSIRTLVFTFTLLLCFSSYGQKKVSDQTFENAMLAAKNLVNPRDAYGARFFQGMRKEDASTFLTEIQVQGLHPTDDDLYQTFPIRAYFQNNTTHFSVATALPPLDKGAYKKMQESGMLEYSIFNRKNLKKYKSHKYELIEGNRLLVTLEREYPSKLAALITPKITDAVETLQLLYGGLAMGQKQYIE